MCSRYSYPNSLGNLHILGRIYVIKEDNNIIKTRLDALKSLRLSIAVSYHMLSALSNSKQLS
jgi:hypothetical protein